MICETCRHFFLRPYPPETTGDCRRYPQDVVVAKTHTCGEYLRRGRPLPTQCQECHRDPGEVSTWGKCRRCLKAFCPKHLIDCPSMEQVCHYCALILRLTPDVPKVDPMAKWHRLLRAARAHRDSPSGLAVTNLMDYERFCAAIREFDGMDGLSGNDIAQRLYGIDCPND